MTFSATSASNKCIKKVSILKHSTSMKEDVGSSKEFEYTACPIGKLDDDAFLDLKVKVLIKVLNSARTVCDEKIKENFDIVWYAMNRCRLPNNSSSRRIEDTPEYKKRLEELRGNDCDFYHGFNSGILATARMYKEHLDFQFEESFIWNKDHSSLYVREKALNSKKKFPNLSVEEFPTDGQDFFIPDLKLSTQEKETCLKIWNEIIMNSLMSVRETALEKEKEAYDLVWFVQFRNRYPKHDDSERIEFGTPNYNEKIEQLRGNEGEFHHGFNSGVLAFSRLLLKVCKIPQDITSIEPSRVEKVSSDYARHIEVIKLSFPDTNVSDSPSTRKY